MSNPVNDDEAIDSRVDGFLKGMPLETSLYDVIHDVYRPYCKVLMKANKREEEADMVVSAVAMLIANMITELALATSNNPPAMSTSFVRRIRELMDRDLRLKPTQGGKQ